MKDELPKLLVVSADSPRRHEGPPLPPTKPIRVASLLLFLIPLPFPSIPHIPYSIIIHFHIHTHHGYCPTSTLQLP